MVFFIVQNKDKNKNYKEWKKGKKENYSWHVYWKYPV